MTSPIIGIDLGTTNSLCSVFEDGKPRLIRNASDRFLTPSVVGVLENDEIVIGDAARELRITRPDSCVSTFKRWMGTDRKVSLGGRQFTAPELSSLVLKSLKQDAEADLGLPISEAVITVPAYFNDHQRKATRLAGELAGLTVRRIINEPTAAALTYGFHDRQSDKKLIVIDLGGGTFDVTLMEIFEGTLEIIATAGESSLGGEDFTDRMVASILERLGTQLETAELRQPLLVSRLRQQCEQAKCSFAQEETAYVRLPDDAGELATERRRVKVTRSSFKSVSRPLMERLQRPVGKVLRDSETNPDEIQDVILVGGATRMFLVQDFVREFLKTDPLCTFNPDEAVALGASVQAALMEDDEAVDDMVMTDVCPFTLGVETAREVGSRIMDGYYTPIIHRNTTIPVSKEEVFHTLHPNQQQVDIVIYQGEARKVKDNLKLGKLKIVDIPPGPAGVEVFIRFTYDLNGILEVEGMAGDSGRKQRCVITSNTATLSEDEIEEAVKRMQDLKFYPREDSGNQRLLRFAERMIGEVSPMHRDDLEAAIQLFENAMHSGDRKNFDDARQSLLMTFSMLGIDPDEYENEAHGSE